MATDLAATATHTALPSKSLASSRTGELNRALALVRPVGMGDEMASDWLAAALGECLYLSDDQFKRGCASARRECTHYSQIIPAIIRASGQAVNMADKYIRDWDKALLDFQAGYPEIGHQRTDIGSRIAGFTKNIQIKDEGY